MYVVPNPSTQREPSLAYSEHENDIEEFEVHFGPYVAVHTWDGHEAAGGLLAPSGLSDLDRILYAEDLGLALDYLVNQNLVVLAEPMPQPEPSEAFGDDHHWIVWDAVEASEVLDCDRYALLLSPEHYPAFLDWEPTPVAKISDLIPTDVVLRREFSAQDFPG